MSLFFISFKLETYWGRQITRLHVTLQNEFNSTNKNSKMKSNDGLEELRNIARNIINRWRKSVRKIRETANAETSSVDGINSSLQFSSPGVTSSVESDHVIIYQSVPLCLLFFRFCIEEWWVFLCCCSE